MAACGLLAGLSILACQANVVLIPGLSIAVLLRNPSHQKSEKSIQGEMVESGSGFLRVLSLELLSWELPFWSISGAPFPAILEWANQLLRKPASHVGLVVAAPAGCCRRPAALSKVCSPWTSGCSRFS